MVVKNTKKVLLKFGDFEFVITGSKIYIYKRVKIL